MRIITTKDKSKNKNKNKKKLILSFFKSKISDDENLFENGKLDSLRVIDLISFIERKTNKKITKSKIKQISFENLNNIIRLF